jgi:hypothetical protein
MEGSSFLVLVLSPDSAHSLPISLINTYFFKFSTLLYAFVIIGIIAQSLVRYEKGLQQDTNYAKLI